MARRFAGHGEDRCSTPRRAGRRLSPPARDVAPTARLHDATRSQRDINVPLNALDAIPFGFAMPDEKDLRSHGMREIPEDTLCPQVR